MKKLFTFLFLVGILFSCEKIDSITDLSPNENNVITTGADLQNTLHESHLKWWQAVHQANPNLALLVAGDAYGLSKGNFGTLEMGMEPRLAFDNNIQAGESIRAIAEIPWYGCLSAVADANDVLLALEKKVTIDQGGTQDQSVQAAAHFVRGLSWGYLGLIFDESVLVDEQFDLEKVPALVTYPEMINASVKELELAIELAGEVGTDFVYDYFNGLKLDGESFQQLAHSYIARFLAQSPRTPEERTTVNWEAVFFHANLGLSYDFAPLANGKDWQSYQQYVFAETGQGPFWARVDQRIVAALDPTQPVRYPEVIAKEETPLTEKKAQSQDARLESDFLFEERINFDARKGEWHFSHYKHQRNKNNPDYMGDGWNFGPMPVFLKADNDLLKTEAALEIDAIAQSISLINQSSRIQRGNLSMIQSASNIILLEAILYERSIELLGSAPMSLWLDRRRLATREALIELSALGGLQLGTPAQLPVPAKELMIRGLEIYTFGGEEDEEGIQRVFK